LGLLPFALLSVMLDPKLVRSLFRPLPTSVGLEMLLRLVIVEGRAVPLRSLLLRLVLMPLRLLLELFELLRFTCGVVVLRLMLLELFELLRLTCGVAVLRLMLLELFELVRLTCGVAVLRLMLLLLVLRLIVAAVDWLERETAADWLLLALLPPCERLRPWAIASDALKIRHPMRAKLIMIFVTEVFIIVMC
jgi:hypothetical protein